MAIVSLFTTKDSNNLIFKDLNGYPGFLCLRISGIWRDSMKSLIHEAHVIYYWVYSQFNNTGCFY